MEPKPEGMSSKGFAGCAWLQVMKGVASSELGPIQRTRERNSKCRQQSHIDWWLYADSDPSPGFEMVPMPQNSQEK